MAIPEAILWPVAAVMSYLIAVLVRWAAGARTRLSGSVVVFLLVMMFAMFLGAAVYFASPGRNGALLGLWGAAGIMAVSVFPVFGLFVQDVQLRVAQGPAFRPRALASVPRFAVGVTLAVFAGEFVMGRAFQLASGDAGPVAAGAAGAFRAVAACLASDWFLFPMALEMGLTVVFLRDRLPPVLSIALALQAASMFASPTAVPDGRWVVGSSLAAAVLMVALFGYVMAQLYVGARLPRPILRYVTELVIVYVLMAGGLAVWAVTGSVLVFAIAAIAQMGVFFTTVVVPESLSGEPTSPEDRRSSLTPDGSSHSG